MRLKTVRSGGWWPSAIASMIRGDRKPSRATFASEPTLGRPYYINENAPKEYNDDSRYTTPAGLNLIMR
jgi:hypothetical protein